MAQLVEHILGKDEVPSSNLGSSSSKKVYPLWIDLFGLCLVSRIQFIRLRMNRRWADEPKTSRGDVFGEV